MNQSFPLILAEFDLQSYGDQLAQFRADLEPHFGKPEMAWLQANGGARSLCARFPGDLEVQLLLEYAWHGPRYNAWDGRSIDPRANLMNANPCDDLAVLVKRVRAYVTTTTARLSVIPTIANPRGAQ